jgi:triosephosphate isomerase
MFVHIAPVVQIFQQRHSGVQVAAQNCSRTGPGAFTGEIRQARARMPHAE